jgi:hypothetical protein
MSDNPFSSHIHVPGWFDEEEDLETFIKEIRQANSYRQSRFTRFAVFYVLFLLALMWCTACSNYSPNSTTPTPVVVPVTTPTPTPIPLPPSHKVAELLKFHDGTVLHNAKTAAIFWGPEWQDATTEKWIGINSFLTGFGGSTYAGLANEYGDSAGLLTTAGQYQGYYNDFSIAGDGTHLQSVIDEVCNVVGGSPDKDTIYIVFSSTLSKLKNSCGYHTAGYCGNNTNNPYVQAAFIPNLDEASCNPYDYQSGHSRGLASIASVTAHEIMETITDPLFMGWFDSSNEVGEIGDKCAWAFPKELFEFTDGSKWKLQMEWSNKAYLDGTGMSNLQQQYGCIYR